MMFQSFKNLSRFRKNCAGNVAIISAVTLPLAVGLVGGTVDYITASKYHAKLQGVADNAAIAAAREVSLANTKTGQIASAALSSSKQEAGVAGVKSSAIKTDVTVSKDKSKITVKVSYTWKPKFAQLISSSVSTVSATAVARIVGSGNICMMGLNPDRKKTISLTKKAQLVGNGCGIYSKSTDRNSIAVEDNAQISVEFVCASGGIKQRASAQVLPTGTTDCPTPPDPLAKRPKPVVGSCDYNKTKLDGFTGTLRPGVYCGGLKLSKNSNPILEKGVYIIKDGPLEVKEGSSLTGTGVGFFLTGKNASFKFKKNTSISLKAPESGAMAGILIFQDPDVPGAGNKLNDATKNEIKSSNASVLEGIIYLPRGRLKIDADGTVAENSAFTAIIADQVILEEGPTMVLNSDYAATSVPVPQGLAGGQVVLAQ